MKEREISRRGFLKTGALALGGLLPAASPAASVDAAESPLPGIDRELDSCCQYCQCRCTTKVQMREGKVVNIVGNPENYWTGGSMCPKGKSLVELAYSPYRILHPLVRNARGGFDRIGYDEAIDMVAERILRAKRENPEDFAHRVVLFMPLWDCRESGLAAQMALRVAGFPDVCSSGETCIASTSTALRLCLGTANSTTNMDEMMHSEVLVLWGINLAEIYPPYMRWIVNAREKGLKVVYFDPRTTPTSNFCDVQVRPRPGTDGALALGIAHVLIREGLYSQAYVREKVNGFDGFAKAAEEYTPEKTSSITWLSAEEIVRLARLLGSSRATLVWLGGSLARYANGLQTIRNIVAVQAITDNLDGPGKGIMDVLGGKPGGEEEFLEHFNTRDMPPAFNFRKIMTNMKRGKVDVLLLNSTYRRYPDANGVKEAISKVGLVVYRGFFMNEEAEVAHLILPGTLSLECPGSVYGSQRQVVWRDKVIDPPGECMPDFKFYTRLGRKIDPERFPQLDTPLDLFELFRDKVDSWRGITIGALRATRTGVTWPRFAEGDPDSKGSILQDGKFPTEDGKVELAYKPLGPVRWEEPEGSPLNPKSDEHGAFQLIFTQGKVAHHWQHTFTNWSSYMAQFSEGNTVYVHPETAEKAGVREGDEAYIETKIGKLKARVIETEGVLPGVVWTPSYPCPTTPFEGNRGEILNTIVPNYWDKVSAQYNGFGCRLVKAS